MKGLAELASFHFLEFEWKNSTSRSWAPLRCSLQCVPPPAGVIRVCGGVRGRGLWVTSPGASTLLLVVLLSSFHLRLGGWLPSCSSRSLLPSDARVVFFVRRFRLPAKVTGHQPTLPVHSKSRPCRCFAFAVHPATNVDLLLPPSPFVLFPSVRVTHPSVIGGSCMRAWGASNRWNVAWRFNLFWRFNFPTKRIYSVWR